MRRIPFRLILAAVAALLAPPFTSAQIGRQVNIPAGTPEDHALAAVTAAATPAEKIALLDKFMADFGKGDMVIIAAEQYVTIYATEKQYDKVFEYADKGLAADPDDYNLAYSAFRAAQENGDIDHEFRYGLAVGDMVSRYKDKPAPEGEDQRVWEVRKKDTLASIADGVAYVSGTLFNAARGLADQKRQADLLERYSLAFADTPYAEPAQTLVADVYRRQQNYTKMNAFAQQVLAKDPNNIPMLLLLADDGTERGANLAQAEADAQKALTLIPQAQKPAGATDEQWNQRISVQQGWAWSSIGQAEIQKKNDAKALEAFQKAAPFLKGETFLLARNQYRMGFALLNLKRTPEARTALTQAASLDSPYKKLAQDKLNSLGAAPPAKKRP